MSIATRSADFNRLITLQSRTDAVAADGQSVPTWADVATVWSSPMPDRGREFYAGLGIVAERPMVFRIRYRADVTAQMRVLYQNIDYTIDSVIDFHDARTETHIYARAGVNAG